ncbi:MAG TPA: peptidase inhibitor family I36 protein [Pyrinomonadaceae bacterium]
MNETKVKRNERSNLVMSKRSYILSLVAAASIGAAVQVVHAQLPTASVSGEVEVQELKSVTIPVSCSRGTPMVRVADEAYARAETISGTNNVTIHGLKLTHKGIGASVLCGGLPAATFSIFVTPQDREIGAPFFFYKERNYAGTPFKVLSNACADLGDANARCVEPSLGPGDKIASVKLGSLRADQRGRGKAAVVEAGFYAYAGRVLLYQYPNFQGFCTELNRDAASTEAATDIGPERRQPGHELNEAPTGMGGAVGSYRISTDMFCPPQVVLYPSPGFAGIPVVVAGSVPDLSAVNFNDAASSIHLFNRARRAAVYEDINYGGGCRTIVMDTPLLSVAGFGFLDKKISSVIVGDSCPTTIHITVKNQSGFAALQAAVQGETSKILPHGTKTWDVPISMSNRTVHVDLYYVSIDGTPAGGVLAKDIGATVSIETFKTPLGYTCTPSSACQ